MKITENLFNKLNDPSSMEDIFKTLNLSNDNEIFRGDNTVIDLYNSLKFITMLFSIHKVIQFNLGGAFLKSASI